jgi:Zn-dependent M16 (insulinase) family peptidase
LQPKPGLNQELEAQEKARLAQARAGMSQTDLQEILTLSQELKHLQEQPDSPQALASIPSLSLQDIDREIKRIPLEASELEGAKLLVHDLFTNGILYLDLGFDLHVLPQKHLPYISLFGRSLLEMGTRRLDFVRLSQRIGRSTGGISPSAYISPIYQSERSAAWLFLRAKTTMGQVGELLAILKEILSEAQFDNPSRFKQMLLEEKAEVEAGLVPAGHRVINSRLRALFNEADWAGEQTSGVEYLFFLRQLVELVEQDWATVLAILEEMRNLLLNRQTMVCNVTLDEANWLQFQPQLAGFLGDLPSATPDLHSWPRPVGSFAEGLSIPAQVNYVGKGANLYSLGYSRNGSLEVVMNYLRTTWLWEKIRVQGGAYGAFSLFNPRSGVLTFLSYRDPNLLETLQVYDDTAQFLRQLDGGRLSQDELTRSIIGVIGALDAYQLPDAKGYTSMARYLVGETDEQRQLWRDQVLGASMKDFYQLADPLEKMQDQAAVVVLGGQEALQAAQAEHPDWLQLRRVL